MSIETPEGNNPHVRAESLDDRDIRALSECMSVLPKGGEIFDVVSESGNSYAVDRREGRCTCPDHRHRDVRCKHIRRVSFAIGETPIPAGVDVDPLLGEHTDGQPRQIIPDGGIIEAGDDGEIVDDDDDTVDGYSFHVEPEKVGGRRYVRCQYCGRELLCSLGGRESLLHQAGCPNKGDDK